MKIPNHPGQLVPIMTQKVSHRPTPRNTGRFLKSFSVHLRIWGISAFLVWITLSPCFGFTMAGEIVFVSQRDGNSEIYVVNADGQNLRRLTFNNVTDYEPAWSPDDKKIAFASRTKGGGLNVFEIFVMDSDGKNLINLTQNPAFDDRMQ
jgi:dipeptidyl aminopeptidase/acylaminoacyl peptidase